MRQLMPFLACLMVLLVNWSAMAHVAEESGGRLAGLEFVAHAPGDGDEVPTDSDNGLPHHHSICHGHDAGAPQVEVAEPGYACAASLRGAPVLFVLTPSDQNVALRPPQA